jgi:hypothetical protein
MAIVDITVHNDADFYRTFACQTVSGDPIDLTGGAMEMMLRRHATDVTVFMRLATDTGEIAIIDPVGGKFTLRITQAQLEGLGLGDYDQSNILTLGGNKIRIWSGVLTNVAGATR